VKLAPAALCGAALLFGCPQKSTPDAGAPGHGGLRVRLPEGWTAKPTGNGLDVGPTGRVVVSLEPTSGPLPPVEALVSALEADGATRLEKESSDTFVGVMYQLNGDAGAVAAFVGAQKAGPKVVRCASTDEAQVEDVKAGFALCRSLSWDDAAK